MDDRKEKRQKDLVRIKHRIQDPQYFQRAVEQLAGKLVHEYFQRYKTEQ